MLPAHAALPVAGRQLNDKLLLFQVSICFPCLALICMTSDIRLKLGRHCPLHEMRWKGLTVYKQHIALGQWPGSFSVLSKQGMLLWGVCGVFLLAPRAF